eukprot:145664_1
MRDTQMASPELVVSRTGEQSVVDASERSGAELAAGAAAAAVPPERSRAELASMRESLPLTSQLRGADEHPVSAGERESVRSVRTAPNVRAETSELAQMLSAASDHPNEPFVANYQNDINLNVNWFGNILNNDNTR